MAHILAAPLVLLHSSFMCLQKGISLYNAKVEFKMLKWKVNNMMQLRILFQHLGYC